VRIGLPLVVLLFLLAGACASDAHLRRSVADGEQMRFELAQTYVRKGAYGAAIPLLRREVAERPQSDAVRALYGVVLREQGLYPQAEKELLAALALAPRNARALDALGVLYDLERRAADAEKAHRAALELAPREALYWNNLGFSLYVARRDAEAIAALERALALDPALTIAYGNLGFAYGRRGDLVAAERSFRTAGGELGVRVNMAIVHEQRGEKERAARLRADARSLDPRVELETR
jgi:Flp pilus assembly protein TadD